MGKEWPWKDKKGRKDRSVGRENRQMNGDVREKSRERVRKCEGKRDKVRN